MTDQFRLRVEAMRLARIAVREEIRDQGLRYKDYSARELRDFAECLFLQHRAELIGEATISLLCSSLREKGLAKSPLAKPHSMQVRKAADRAGLKGRLFP